MEPLLRADWVIVATPFQYHLHDPAEQKVVQSVVNLFDESWDLAGDFKLQSEQWQLEPAITVRLYRRSQSDDHRDGRKILFPADRIYRPAALGKRIGSL